MTIQECYKNMGADYEDVRRRLMSDERISRFLRMFKGDLSFATLTDAMQSGNAEEAFRAAHSLKGICMNLSLTKLQNAAAALTEALRGGLITPDAETLYDRAKETYEQTIRCIACCVNA